MIRRLGCFHFAEGYQDPIGALNAALDEVGDLSGSLVVLPEAFNNGRPYYDHPQMSPLFSAANVLRSLADLAIRHQASFVVGLLDPPNNSCAIVRPDGWQMLSHKKTDDTSRNYVPWLGTDPANPITVEDIAIGVLLCKDVDCPGSLIADLDALQASRSVVCIPACMSAVYFSGEYLNSLCWSGKYLVLANSRPDGCDSFITNNRRQKVASTADRSAGGNRRNQVIIRGF
jgi:predicted amidohydrolase